MNRLRVSLGGVMVLSVALSACGVSAEEPVGESEAALSATIPYWARCSSGKTGNRFVVELASGSCTKHPDRIGISGRWEGRSLASEGGKATCEFRWISGASAPLGSLPEYGLLAAMAAVDEQDVIRSKAIVPFCGAARACGSTAECAPRSPAPPVLRVDPRLLAPLRVADVVPFPRVVATAPTPAPTVIRPIDKMGGCGACAVADGEVAYVYLRPEMVGPSEETAPYELVLSHDGVEEVASIDTEVQSFTISLATMLDGRARTAPLPPQTSAWIRMRTR